jgi:glycine/D-amino acid oxidase-like deaminating enzyme
MGFETSRRQFLQGAFAAGALLAARSRVLALNYERHFAPVKVSRDRVIREVVGLRPYRAEGFVVEAERAGHKLIVHNYGHGGAGMTLSWGTASLAADLLRDFLGARTPSSALSAQRERVSEARPSGRAQSLSKDERK